MKKLFFGLLAFVVLCSHDMFLKLDGYFLQPQTQSEIQLFNGSFEKSENVIARTRMLDASLVGNGKRIAIDTTQWFEKDSITYLDFKTGNAGTWVAGVSTAPRNIELDATSFNDYLEHDGVLDMLEWRKTNNALEEDAVEKYSKHVKTIFQVGDTLSTDWNTNLGYPIEFIPLENPYSIHPGHDLKVRLLYKGKPLADQLVYLGNELEDKNETAEHTHANGKTHSHTHEDEDKNVHTHASVEQLRTNGEGVVTFNITAQGVWYLRTIYMQYLEDETLTHESNWATLTFAVGNGNQVHSHDADSHSHDHGDETHEHDHEDEGFPSYIFWVGSIVMVALLFFFFRRKK